MHVLVVNPGSSTLKLHVLDGADEVVASREVTVTGGRSDAEQVEAFLAAHPDVTAAGVRFVHGGPDLSEAVVVDQKVEDRLEAAADLAPLHDPPALDALRAVRRARPDVAVVAERAALALAVYLHRLRAGIASMASAMDGFDAVVFTGGVGENSSRVRGDVCSGLGFLGLAVDSERNAASDAGDRDIAVAGSRVPVLVIRSREDQEIAREVRRLL